MVTLPMTSRDPKVQRCDLDVFRGLYISITVHDRRMVVIDRLKIIKSNVLGKSAFKD